MERSISSSFPDSSPTVTMCRKRAGKTPARRRGSAIPWPCLRPLLTRETNYLRKLVGLPPVAGVKADELKGEGGRE